MRRADQVGRAEQHVGLGRFLDEHVEARAGDVARDQQVAHRQLVDQPAARAVDHAHALLGLHQVGAREDVLRLLGERRVHGDEVGARQQLLQRHLLDAELRGALLAQERVVGDHAHLEADRALGDDRADVAAADQAQRLEAELDAHEAVLLPLAGLRAGVGRRDLAGDREHQGDRVLGRGDGVAERRVHHHDAVRRRRLDVDIVDADAGAADDLELLRFRQHLGRDLGGRADRQPLVVADDGAQLGRLQAGLEIDVAAALGKDLDGARRKLVGDENLWLCHYGLRSSAGSAPLQWRVMIHEKTRHWSGAPPAMKTRARSRRRPSRATAAALRGRLFSTVAPHQMRRPGGASR